ncbi:MAG: glycosyltransferase family 4 protein [Verrucomicrobia bacterium]|nr:glycosyltransferase family 4 protein [Verrucomicrobiota bacterium]
MRILFFTDHFKPEPTAAASHISERCALWAKWGHEVTAICAAPNFPEGKVMAGYRNAWRSVQMDNGVRVVRVKTFIHPNEGFFLRSLDYLSYAISAACFSQFEPRPDVVISSSPHLFVGVAGLVYSGLRRLPHVLEVRDLWPASITATSAMKPGLAIRGLEKLESMLYRQATRVIALSPSFVEHMCSRGARRDRVDVVINGANLDLFRPKPRNEALRRQLGLAGCFVVGYLGTMGLAHGLENAIDAMVCLKGKAIKLLFVGPGPARRTLATRAKELGLDNVVFVPPQLRENMPEYWSLCDASLIHLRNSEVFESVVPSKIFESMAMGLPIIYVGPRGEGAAIVQKCGCGVVVPPADPRALASVIEKLAGAPTECRFLAENSLKSAPQFSRERQAEKSLESLEKAGARRLHE